MPAPWSTAAGCTCPAPPERVLDGAQGLLRLLGHARRDRHRRVVEAQAGCTLADVVRVRYLLPDRADFEPCWPLLRSRFGAIRPAATMMVCGLADPRMRIEIEVTARRPGSWTGTGAHSCGRGWPG